MDLETIGRKKIIRYLRLKGYDILDKDFDGFIVASNYDGIHFVDASTIDYAGMSKLQVNKSREECEQVMCKWFASHDHYDDVDVCIDVCNLIVFENNRALIKHYVNVQEGL